MDYRLALICIFSTHTRHEITVTVHQPLLLRIKLTVIYFTMQVLGAFIMLLVMTFNAGIFLTVIVGLTFGWMICPKPETTEHHMM